MWTGQEMTLADGLMISAVGRSVIIISKIINTAVKDKAPKQAAVAAAPAPALDGTQRGSQTVGRRVPCCGS